MVVVLGLVGDVAASRPPSRGRRSGGAGPGVPGTAQGRASLLVAQVGHEARRRRSGSVGEARVDLGQRRRRPAAARARRSWRGRCRASRITGVRWRDRDARRLDRRVEAVGRRAGGDHRQRRLAVAAVERHQQVGRLGLRRHARSRGRRAGRRSTTSGSSIATARPIVSAFRSMPGPLVAVTPRWPAKAAPSAMLAAAISSSAWIVRTPKRRWRESACSSSEAGVIG